MPPKKKVKADAASWEWLDDDNNWNAFDAVDSQCIEAGYSTGAKNLVTSDLTFNKGFSTKYTFDFSKMTQINGDSGKSRAMRRIAPPGEFSWEWLDDAGVFVPFYDEDNELIEKLSLQAGIDTGKEAKTKALSFNKGYGSQYVFTFKSGTDTDGKPQTVGSQKNMDSGRVRDIRRIQKKSAWDAKGFGIAAKGAVEEAAKAAKKAEAEASSEDSGARGKLAKEPSKGKVAAPAGGFTGSGALGSTGIATPGYWSSATALGKGTLGAFSEVSVDLKSEEGKEIANLIADQFKASGKSVSIDEVERVENATLWTFYALTRAHVAKRNDGDPKEKRMFYGDHNKTNMATICKLGFDTRVAPNGSYGQGLYFRTNAPATDPMCCKVGKQKQIFVVRAAVGAFAPGTSGMRRPPPKDPKKPSGDIFDSCVDKVADPGIHVFFTSSQMYPEYVVTYTVK